MKREYVASGRNHATWVDQFREGSSGTWGTSVGPFASRKLAESVARALNEAYEGGREEASADLSEIVE